MVRYFQFIPFLTIPGIILCFCIMGSQVSVTAQNKGNDATKKGKGGQGKNGGNNASKEKGKGNDKGGPQHVFSGPAPIHPFDVILGRPTDKSITLSVTCYQDNDGYLTYWPQSGNQKEKTEVQSFKANNPVEINLSGLKPDSQYFYTLHFRTGTSGTFASSEEHSFRTQRKPGGEFRFTIQADSHLDQGTRTAVYEKTLANVLGDKPDFHVDLGDTFMTDKYPDFRESLPQYIAQRYYFGLVGHSVPLFLVLGNHDGERFDRFDGTPNCMPVWSAITRKKYYPNPYPDGFYSGNTQEVKHVGKLGNYFAWEWGDALFISLDPFWYTPRTSRNRPDGNWTRTLGEAQYHWLEKTLASSKAKFKFVFIHHLVGGLDSSARGGSEAASLYEWGGKGNDGKDEFRSRRPGWTAPIHQLLVKHKVSAVFHGHDHFYAKQELDNVQYVMVPQPGQAGFDRLRNVEEYGYIRGTFLPPSGHIRVTVSPEKTTVEYVRSYLPQVETTNRKNGDIGHTFSIRP